MSSKAVTPAPLLSSSDPQTYEQEHVHSVYNAIAPHFSSTRYKPWPIVNAFLSSIPPGWIGLDSGCGNGKYLALPSDRTGSVWTIGLDRSRGLLDIAKLKGGEQREVIHGDALEAPWRAGAFDYTISIATIHHLTTQDRRVLAVKRLLEACSPIHGRILIYVWAIEQDKRSKRTVPTASNIQVDDGAEAAGVDVFVPWVLSQKHNDTGGASTDPPSEQVYQRYYHMFAAGELGKLVRRAAQELNLTVDKLPSVGYLTKDVEGVEIVQEGWERSNYYVELRRWKT